MSEHDAPPGTIVTRGRELLTLNWAGQWLAPGVRDPFPAPDLSGWTIVRWGETGCDTEDAPE